VLFYNHKHEFIGIDDEGLKLLNYASLEDLLGVCQDAADLFAKEPGYIHNFKSFSWINFLLHADSDARTAIVHGNGRTFSCTLEVHNFFMCSEPSQNGYMIEMTHITSVGEDTFVSNQATSSSYPAKGPTVSAPTMEMPMEKVEKTVVLPDYTHITPTPLSEPSTLDIPSYNDNDFELPAEEPLEDLYAKLSLPLSEEELEEIPSVETIAAPMEIIPTPSERPMLGDVHYTNAEKEFLTQLKVDQSYRFDPNVAAHELGLPVDLIQEFIGDFIQQSHEFKDELFEAVLKGDTNNVKILSHKLKGVAANLRIEDAFETLSIINTSNDPIEIEANLKYFYTIIDKLEGKETFSFESTTIVPDIEEHGEAEFIQPALSESTSQDDIYEFALKDDAPLMVQEEELNQANVPEIPLEPKVEFSKEKLDVIDLMEMPTSDDENSIIDLPPQRLHYDKIAIAGALGIEHDFFDELIHEYKHDALKSGKEIVDAIGAFDTHSWKRIAGQLKGISDNLRLNEISDELAILSQTNDAQEAHKASKRLNSFLEQL